MELIQNSTSFPLQDLSNLTLQSPRALLITLIGILLTVGYFFTGRDPYSLKRVPAIPRSRIGDAFSSGVYWRFFVPRLLPYIRDGYYKYSKKGKTFRIYIGTFQCWVYVLPQKYLAQVKNQATSELSCRDLIDEVIAAKFSAGHFDNFEVQVGSKLMNANLTGIKSMVQVRTEQILHREIGSPNEWKRFNARKLTQTMMKHVSGRVVFGEALADNPAFLRAMDQYTMQVIPSMLVLRYFYLGPLRNLVIYLIHLRQRPYLAAAARFVTEDVAERKRMEILRPAGYERPVDCVQWSLDDSLAEEQKSAEAIAHRLLLLSAAIIDTPTISMLNLLYDAAAHQDCLDELRAEINECLSESDGAWTESSMSKMRKLDSFMQETFRLNPGIASLTIWRLIMSDTFRFDDGLVLPKGAKLVFPTMCMMQDPEIFPNPEKFDHLRFYNMREEDRKAGVASATGRKGDIRYEWFTFGYGRQACPGRFYSIRLMKTIFGELIRRYDIRYAGPDQARRGTLDLEPVLAPDPTVELEFRLRA
ncbi:cytochrome P450 [Aspergillus karnatakaensis]|uniref:cytochrome P450 n=1 Tax=Aspergillus karnatakaensis TaxID=1810916 RepID=UPI003CCD1BAA